MIIGNKIKYFSTFKILLWPCKDNYRIQRIENNHQRKQMILIFFKNCLPFIVLIRAEG